MDKEKRKRGDEEEGQKGEGRKKMEAEGAAPTEEEVEEFFAILRRMKMAVKYFERGGRNGELGWREALETEEVVVVEEEEGEGEGVVVVVDDDHHKAGMTTLMKRPRKGGVEQCLVLDLNAAAPEEGQSNIDS